MVTVSLGGFAPTTREGTTAGATTAAAAIAADRRRKERRLVRAAVVGMEWSFGLFEKWLS
jgi:hypothetical protein